MFFFFLLDQARENTIYKYHAVLCVEVRLKKKQVLKYSNDLWVNLYPNLKYEK